MRRAAIVGAAILTAACGSGSTTGTPGDAGSGVADALADGSMPRGDAASSEASGGDTGGTEAGGGDAGGPTCTTMGCPETLPDGGATCTGALSCGYADHSCTCTGGAWQCACCSNADCPETKPAAGTSCTSSSPVCAYGDHACTCSSGQWVCC